MKFPGNYEWPPLLARINAAGAMGDEERCAEIISSFAIAEAKAFRKNEVADIARMLQDGFLLRHNYSAGETAAWPIKKAEAIAYNASGKVTDAPLLSAEAAASGRSLASLVQRVSQNATAFSAFTAACAGVRTRHQDAIELLTTFDEIVAYNIAEGWPS